ncbi:fungal fucose-specific lectin-domain-containing protein [Cubamyces lactineus]|nr:fungal fucose-specific lectin-domain-containing protein [Cubamyces lactineus]
MPLKRGVFGEYAEHGFIGDAINLTLVGGKKVPASDHEFKLTKGLVVTYGQINGLAGDFYGTTKPSAQEQSARFIVAYNTLAAPRWRQPKEVQDILRVLQTEVDAVNKALHDHTNPSEAYNRLPDISAKLQWLTLARPFDIPIYLSLALINWDHFGEDARTAYNAGNATALQAAVHGELELAYTLNAFADHFLEDSFSAGHLRTPRRALHGSVNIAYDACAKFMHDKDCDIGLTVKNPAGETWTCYGDKRVLDKKDAEDLRRCVTAIQASADEVSEAFVGKNAPSSSNYKAWTIAPVLASAQDPSETLSALFRYADAEEEVLERRSFLNNRRVREYTVNWDAKQTVKDYISSGWWKYPITRVYYQNSLGGILENAHIDGQWKETVNSPQVLDAAPFTPLAAINWDDGNQIRLYYLNADYTLQEYCCVDGEWSTGALSSLNIAAAPNTSITAFQYEDDNGVHIPIYLQEAGSYEIQGVWTDGCWRTSKVMGPLARGTRCAPAQWDDGKHVRVYYQAEHNCVLGVCKDDNGEWYPGATADEGSEPGHAD